MSALPRVQVSEQSGSVPAAVPAASGTGGVVFWRRRAWGAVRAASHLPSLDAIIERLGRHRWPVVIIVALLALFFEREEVRPITLQADSIAFWLEFIYLVVVLPLSLACALRAVQARTNQMRQAWAAAAERERQRFAQELHDTLAQQLGYLHLKLDQWVNGYELQDPDEVGRQLVQMRDVAGDASRRVRGVLAVLTPATANLREEMLDYAHAVGTRAGFETEIECHWDTWCLPFLLQREIFYVFREALINTEKHAQAQHVRVQLEMRESGFALRVFDDGRGFEVDGTVGAGHYGLSILRQRARDLGAHLQITSQPGRGTELELRVPRAVIEAHARTEVMAGGTGGRPRGYSKRANSPCGRPGTLSGGSG